MALNSLEQFFSALRSRQTPALLWYSQPGERIELSGRVLENWVAKTANFLVDECEVESGDTVTLAMPTHWRSLVIALAALRTGAQLQLLEQGQDAAGAAHSGEVCFAFDPEVLDGLEIDYPVLVDRGPLSPRYMGELPAGAVDYCAEVRAHGDVYSQFETPQANQPAFAGRSLTYENLLAEVASSVQQLAEQSEAPSVQMSEPAFVTAGYLKNFLALLAAGRGVVVLDPALEWEPTRVQKVLADEKAEVLPSQSL